MQKQILLKAIAIALLVTLVACGSRADTSLESEHIFENPTEVVKVYETFRIHPCSYFVCGETSERLDGVDYRAIGIRVGGTESELREYPLIHCEGEECSDIGPVFLRCGDVLVPDKHHEIAKIEGQPTIDPSKCQRPKLIHFDTGNDRINP